MENAAKMETQPHTERRGAKIRKFENKRYQTTQAVEVRHPQTENRRGSKESTRGTIKKKRKGKFCDGITHVTVAWHGGCVANNAAQNAEDFKTLDMVRDRK